MKTYSVDTNEVKLRLARLRDTFKSPPKAVIFSMLLERKGSFTGRV